MVFDPGDRISRLDDKVPTVKGKCHRAGYVLPGPLHQLSATSFFLSFSYQEGEFSKTNICLENSYQEDQQQLKEKKRESTADARVLVGSKNFVKIVGTLLP